MSSETSMENGEAVHKKTQVLVLEVKYMGVREYFEREADAYGDCEFHFCPCVGQDASRLALLEACRDIVIGHNIDVVLNICDRGVPILAALKTEFHHLRGPSYEAFHLTFFKIPARERIIPEENNIPFFQLPAKIVQDEIPYEKIMAAVDLPAIAKPGNASTSNFILKINKKEDLMQLQSEAFANAINGLMTPIQDLIKKYLDNSKYDSLTPKYILEPYIDHAYSGTTVHTVDSVVARGKMIPWAISDNLYWFEHPESFMGATMPTSLSEEMQDKAFDCLSAVFEKLRPYGFDDQYLDAEVFCFPDGRIKIMEVNGRMAVIYKEFYANILDYPGTNVHVHIDVTTGKPGPDKRPSLKPDTCSFIAYLITYGTGPAEKFVNFGDAKNNYPTREKDISVNLVVREDTPITQVGDSGFLLGYVTIVGTSFDHCMQKMDGVKTRLIRDKDTSAWFKFSPEAIRRE